MGTESLAEKHVNELHEQLTPEEMETVYQYNEKFIGSMKNGAIDIFKLPVHPSADEFEMVSPEELQELADDIKANGLIHPIVIQDGMLIDGRNRLAACGIAGIDNPTTVELEGDAKAYIISSNINRRHMTKGQQAMTVACIYPKTQYGKEAEIRKNSGFDASYLVQARAILEHAPDLIKQVKSGGKSLNDAYKTALQRKIAATEGDEALNKLIAGAPDLAELVKEERMELSEALAAMEKRVSNDRVNRLATTNAIKAFIAGGKNFQAGNKSRAKLLNKNRKDIELILGYTIEEAIQDINSIKEDDELLKLLEGIE